MDTDDVEDTDMDMDCVEYDERPEDWGMDEAYLHFDPDAPARGSVDVVEGTSAVAGPSRPQAAPMRGAGPSREPGVAAVEPAKKPRSRKGKQPASSSPATKSVPEVTDAEFETRMHAVIMQDKTLHLRIIRYEASLLRL